MFAVLMEMHNGNICNFIHVFIYIYSCKTGVFDVLLFANYVQDINFMDHL